MRQGIGAILFRVAAVAGVLVVVGIVLKLLVAILTPVLPESMNRDLMAGWDLLYGYVASAMPAVMAGVILISLLWVISNRRQ